MKKIGKTKKVSITLPENIWDYIESQQNQSETLRTLLTLGHEQKIYINTIVERTKKAIDKINS